MSNIISNIGALSLPEIEDRIAILRDNIRQLVEQAAGSSGAADEDRNADRISTMSAELAELVKEQESRTKK